MVKYIFNVIFNKSMTMNLNKVDKYSEKIMEHIIEQDTHEIKQIKKTNKKVKIMSLRWLYPATKDNYISKQTVTYK